MNQTTVRALVVIGSIIALAMVAPLIWLAAQATFGLLFLAVAGVASMMLVKSIPLLVQKTENFILRARKAEAQKNPIEELQNILKERSNQVTKFKAAVANIGAQVKSLSDMVAQRKRERAGYDATAQETSIAAMRKAHDELTQKYRNAEKALEEFKVAIADKEFEWKFSQAGQQAIASLNATSGKDLMEQLMADTAFSSVTDNFNRVFAELELEAQHLTDAQQLSYNDDMVIDVSSINLTRLEKV